MEALGTVVNCEKEGHCWHEETAVGSLYCCKCGTDKYRLTYTANLYLERLTARGIQDIACGRISKIPNIRQVREV